MMPEYIIKLVHVREQWQAFVDTVMTFRIPYMWPKSWPAEWLLGFCSMEAVK
jgi:hypothetical protein